MIGAARWSARRFTFNIIIRSVSKHDRGLKAYMSQGAAIEVQHASQHHQI